MAFLLACFGGGRVAVAPHSDGPPTWQQHLHRHFHLLKTLGQGGYSIVYRVLRRADGCEYALKVTDLGRLTPWSRLAAVREVQVLAGLAAHPCITTFREAFCVGSRLCIVTDLADGGDLKRRIEEHAAVRADLPEREVWSAVLQVALALQHLHANRVLHRDVKPQNVLLSSNGLMQLTDFGICGQLSSVFTRKEAGSPQYKAPEMWRDQPYSFSSDLWSLGCLIYEACTGRPLFDAPGATTPAEAVEAVRQQVLGLSQPPPLPRHYSGELQQLAAALLQPDPAARPTADELLALPPMAARLRELPPPVQPHVTAAASQLHQATFKGEHLLEPVSFEPVAVNACLPPAAYADGTPGVADGLLREGSTPRRTPRRTSFSLFESLLAGQSSPSGASSENGSGRGGSASSIASLDLASLDTSSPPSSSDSLDGMLLRLGQVFDVASPRAVKAVSHALQLTC